LRGRIMAAYSFIVVGLSQVAGSFVAGAVARVAGVAWASGAGGVLMLAYAVWAFRSYNSVSFASSTTSVAVASSPSQPVSIHT